jgi:acid stress-induced BolA-like protein IbaG/YrbA
VDLPTVPRYNAHSREAGRAARTTLDRGIDVTTDEIRKRIESSLPGTEALVSGEDAHYSAVVVSTAFEGKSRIDRHQMIYALFKDEMAREEIHALSLKTTTPSERRAAAVRLER